MNDDIISMTNAIISLIRLNNKNTRKLVDSNLYNLHSYINQYGTIHYHPGRRSGLSTYIENHATIDDLIIGIPQQECYFSKSKAKFVSFKDMQSAAGKRYDTIYLDTCSGVIDNAVDLFARDSAQTFIVLG